MGAEIPVFAFESESIGTDGIWRTLDLGYGGLAVSRVKCWRSGTPVALLVIVASPAWELGGKV